MENAVTDFVSQFKKALRPNLSFLFLTTSCFLKN
jgi:hypothetical protein